MIRRAGRFSPSVAIAAAGYLALAAGSANGVGIVGEVAIGWALPAAPRVLVALDPPRAATEGGRAGPLAASQVRPVESLVVGPVVLPLAVNAYTGGPPDWPARAARALTGSLAAGTATHVALGLALLALAHRFLRFHGTPTAAAATAFVLATDWGFVFYRKVLGGTEVLLQAAGLLIVWALWSRRWKGGHHGTTAIAVGVGLGLLAKTTFVATLLAIGLAAILTRRDRPALKPPPRVNGAALAGLVLLCLSPLWVSALHHGLLPAGPRVVSHDTLTLQIQRAWSGWTGPAPAREGLMNLLYFLGNPLAFFHGAYGTVAVPPVSALRTLGFGVTALGVALEWRDRAASPSGGLLRFLAILVPLQVALLFVANRDLHHLAQATVSGALLVGLAADRVAAALAPPRSAMRALATGIFVLPHVLAGVHHLASTDAVIATARSPGFTEGGQAALVEALRGAGVTRLVTSDYEVYGMLEARAPEIAVTHTWGALSRGERDGSAILRLASDGWYLSVRPSAPMIYNWTPNAESVARAARDAGVRATLVAERADGRSAWASIYRVDALP